MYLYESGIICIFSIQQACLISFKPGPEVPTLTLNLMKYVVDSSPEYTKSEKKVSILLLNFELWVIYSIPTSFLACMTLLHNKIYP